MTLFPNQKRVFGIEVFRKNNELICNFIEAQLVKSDFEVINYLEQIRLDQIPNLKQNPQCLVLHSEETLVKRLADKDSTIEEELSNFDIETVFYQYDRSLLKLVKRNSLLENLQDLSLRKIHPSRLYLGVLDRDLYTDIIVDGLDTKTLTIGNDTYPESLRNILIASLDCLLDGQSIKQSSWQWLEKHLGSQHEKNKYVRRIKAIMLISAFLIVSTLSFRVTTSLYVNSLQQGISKNQPEYIKYSKLKRTVREKEELLKINNMNGQSEMSFLLDRIAASMSETVSLNSLDVFIATQASISLTGVSLNSFEFYGWMETVKQLSFVEEGSLLFHYDDISSETNGNGAFELSFKIND